MAKSRFGKKKGKKSGRKGRKSAGKRLAKYNKAVKRFGKVKAHEMVFGKRPSLRKKVKRGRKGAKRTHRKVGGKSLFKAALLEIQKRNGTEGWPATAGEREQAEQIAYFESEMPRGFKPGSTEKDKLRQKIQAEKRTLVRKIAAAKLAARKRKLAAEDEAEAEREAEAELRDL